MKGISGFYRHQWQVLLVCLFLLLGTMLLSLMFGATSVSIQTIIESFTHFDATNQAHQVIQTVRLPRILGAAFVGGKFSGEWGVSARDYAKPIGRFWLAGYQCWGWLGLSACFCFPPSGKLLVAFSCFFSWCRRECGTDLLSF